MKVQRQDYQEDYNTTVDWIKDFSDSFKKSSFYLDNYKDINKIRKFNTIEEKLADIKSRIGFELIKEMQEEIEVKTASTDCHCNNECKNCQEMVKSAKFQERDLELMTSILKYIRDMIKHEHTNISPITVITRCREEPGLRFDSLPIDHTRLSEFIDSELKKYSVKPEDVSYVPRDDDSILDKNPEAEYWTHAFPNRG